MGVYCARKEPCFWRCRVFCRRPRDKNSLVRVCVQWQRPTIAGVLTAPLLAFVEPVNCWRSRAIAGMCAAISPKSRADLLATKQLPPFCFIGLECAGCLDRRSPAPLRLLFKLRYHPHHLLSQRTHLVGFGMHPEIRAISARAPTSAAAFSHAKRLQMSE